VSRKSDKIARLLQSCQGQDLDAHYLGYFECFNQQLFFEAHDVLEELWLRERGQVKDLFYKGLIQLAGAFVHLQKNRLSPAAALLKLSQTNLARYPSPYERLAIVHVDGVIREWQSRIQSANRSNPLTVHPPPRLSLET
jgi:predicted metal-dependent hydrolase